MRRLIASFGIVGVFAAGAILAWTPVAPATGASGCQPAPTTPTTATPSTTPTTPSTTPATTTTTPTTTTSAPTVPQPVGHPLNDNTVENCVDGTVKARSQLQVRSSHGPNADPVNFAYAYAHDCSTGCQAIAVAFQVVLEQQGATSQTPQNVALAVNYQCNQCGVFAYADQYVVDVPKGTRLSSATRRQIATIQQEADADVQAKLTFADLDSKLRALASQLKTVVDTGLQEEHAPPTNPRSTEHLNQSGHE